MGKAKLVLYISMSLDGYIATKDNDLSWLSIVAKEGEDYGYTAFNERIGSYIVGRTTYEVVLQLTGGIFPHAEKHDCYVITREEKAAQDGVTFYNGDIEALVNRLKEGEKDIYCDGGSQVVKMLMEKDLIDEYIISLIPIVLGDGIRLFRGGTPGIQLKALPVKQFDSGLIQLHYIREA